MGKYKISFNNIFFFLMMVKLTFNTGCMATAAKNSEGLGGIFLICSVVFFIIAIIALIGGLTSKNNPEKFWTGVTVALIMSLVFFT